MKLKRTIGLLLLPVAMLAVTSTAWGTLILSHSGANDPATEGWAPTVEAGATVAPVIDDMGSGFDAWEVKNSSGTGKVGYFGHAAVTPAVEADIATGGWSVRANLRVDDTTANGYDEALAPAPGFVMRLGAIGHWVLLEMSTDSSGNPTARLKGGTGLGNVSDIITTSGSGYHTYDLRTQPMTSLADLYIDGTKVISDFDINNTATFPNQFIWGNWATGSDGAGYWNSLEFETSPAAVPEPSGSAILLLGAVSLALERRRRLKS
ncbi:hypothetical protein [Adhaeretor mobilis]|uniref:Sialidase n=1 Tax=Adhaeretor mobilis TaxID=1930276 RepID=A0A517MTI0_9BACT|nr:hypothetical protein [Adhaeretor mobilis]QDS98186.1 Sialidase precursor [Adhaeretor mobilis]